MKTSNPALPAWTIKVRRMFRWHRRKLAALCACLAIVAGLNAVTASAADAAVVIVAAKALPAGSKLTANDLRVAHVPRQHLPDQALTDANDAIGRTLVAPLTAGSMLTAASILGGNANGAQDGEQLVPIRIADSGVAQLLRVGDRVSVVSVGFDGTQTVLATKLRVAGLPQPSGSSISTESGALVLLAADAYTAAKLAAASTQGRIAVTLS